MMSRSRVLFDRCADYATEWAGAPSATLLAVVAVVAWTLGGFVIGFTDTYQLIINTGTTIITFLMVFLIQHTQNKQDKAVQLKLDELVKAVQGARNELAGIEDKPDELSALKP